MQFIEPQDILSATNGGLDIILHLYPQAEPSVHQKNRKFKIRDDEKTASVSLHFKREEQVWLITDFGGDQQPRNGIACYVLEKGVEYGEALKQLAAGYGVLNQQEAARIIRAEYSERDATADEKDGEWSYEIPENMSLSDTEIETIVSKNVLSFLGWKTSEEKHKIAYSRIRATFKDYNWYSLTSYTLIKNRKAKSFSSTENYPIFLIDEGTHKKIYQPLNPDKAYRFMYDPTGKKPKDFIHGMTQLEALYKKRKKQQEDAEMADKENGAEENLNKKGSKKKESVKEQEVILVSGGSDAINVALMGYRVIWMNSETARLSHYQYDRLMLWTEKLYQLGDIDNTGLRAMNELAMEYLDIYNIELPKALLERRDRRGNPCKDLRDYMNHYTIKDFRLLLYTSLPYRFWEKTASYEGRGNDRVFAGYRYEFDNVQGYNFLQKNGFFRLPMGDKETDWTYIKITGSKVARITPERVKAFFKDFLRERMMDKELKNAMFRTTQLSDGSLSNLDEISIDFTDCTKESQFIFFQNKTVEVSKTGIHDHRDGSTGRYIWEQDVLPHRYELPKEPPFKITRDEDGNHDIQILSECPFLKFLIQTSRVHWREELEGDVMKALTPEERVEYVKNNRYNIAGPLLSAEHQDEQKQHLINKLFAIGYLLHRHKVKNKAWFVWAQDNKINDDGQSHGGSGKSILFDMAMRIMQPNNFYINGRNAKLTEDPHKYDGLTEYHRYIFIEDAHEYLRLDVFYNDVTGDIQVNPKGKQPYVIPFARSGKFAFTTNYTARNLGPSTERRMVITAFSDYYHNKGETDDYNEFRDPKTDLGITLFEEFDHGQWNDFYNTMLHALVFYLGTEEKIKPAMENVTKRNLIAVMGHNFMDWAQAYFSEEGGNTDRLIVREYVFLEYKHSTGNNKETPQKFQERVKAFCRYYGYGFNPDEAHLKSKTGQIIKKTMVKTFDGRTGVWTENKEQTMAKEHWYIQTKNEKIMQPATDISPLDKPPF